MRIDDFLSTVGVIKRRTIAKDLGSSGLLEVNGQKIKPAYQVKLGDIVVIKGTRGKTIEILNIPNGSVAKEDRPNYYKELPAT